MTQARLTGTIRSYLLADALRALYGLFLPDVVGTMQMMPPEVVFVPQNAMGAVSNGGDEGISISNENAPIVTRISTNNAGFLLGFRAEQFTGQCSFMLGHGQVVITPTDAGFVLNINYADRDQHPQEQERVARTITPHLENLQVQ